MWSAVISELSVNQSFDCIYNTKQKSVIKSESVLQSNRKLFVVVSCVVDVSVFVVLL